MTTLPAQASCAGALPRPSRGCGLVVRTVASQATYSGSNPDNRIPPRSGRRSGLSSERPWRARRARGSAGGDQPELLQSRNVATRPQGNSLGGWGSSKSSLFLRPWTDRIGSLGTSRMPELSSSDFFNLRPGPLAEVELELRTGRASVAVSQRSLSPSWTRASRRATSRPSFGPGLRSPQTSARAPCIPSDRGPSRGAWPFATGRRAHRARPPRTPRVPGVPAA